MRVLLFVLAVTASAQAFCQPIHCLGEHKYQDYTVEVSADHATAEYKRRGETILKLTCHLPHSADELLCDRGTEPWRYTLHVQRTSEELVADLTGPEVLSVHFTCSE